MTKYLETQQKTKPCIIISVSSIVSFGNNLQVLLIACLETNNISNHFECLSNLIESQINH